MPPKSDSQILSNMNIRSIESSDFAFIRSLAAQFPTFTVPSDYILWFLTTFHPEYCRVLEQSSGEIRGYILAMPTSNPPNGIAVWQVATAETSAHAFTLEHFVFYLRDLAERTRATTVFFTTPPNLPSVRLIRSLAAQFADCEVAQCDPVPVGQGEHQFRITIRW